MSNDEKIVQAQLEEAKLARESARHDKHTARHELESAQALKGSDRTKQPDDIAML